MTECTVEGCGTGWDGGQRFAGCAVEVVCLEHCADFAGHVSIVGEVDRAEVARAAELDEMEGEAGESSVWLG